MFFTKLGTVAAWLLLIAGAIRIATGMLVAVNLDTPGFDPTRYLGSKSSGWAIDRGTLYILGAAVLGMLTEISRSVRQRASALAEKQD